MKVFSLTKTHDYNFLVKMIIPKKSLLLLSLGNDHEVYSSVGWRNLGEYELFFGGKEGIWNFFQADAKFFLTLLDDSRWHLFNHISETFLKNLSTWCDGRSALTTSPMKVHRLALHAAKFWSLIFFFFEKILHPNLVGTLWPLNYRQAWCLFIWRLTLFLQSYF